jgi:hypothetical protein
MPDMKYDSEGLRAGARRHRDSGEEADQAGTALRSASVTARPFGRVAAAESLSAALSSAQQRQAAGAEQAAAGRETMGQQSDTAGDLGDQNTAATTTAADAATVRAVADGMT